MTKLKGPDGAGEELPRNAHENKKLSVKNVMDPLKAAFPPEERSTMQSYKQVLQKVFQDAINERADRAIKERFLQEGMRQGKEEGMRQGKEEGMREALRVQIRQRFGRLPRAAATRIRAAESDELSGWLQRILYVRSVAELFAESD